MTLSPSQASENLKEIERTARRSGQAFGYVIASPHLILWGIIWFLGYAGTALLIGGAHDKQIGPMWLALDLAGIVGSAVIGYLRDSKTADSAGRREGRRMFGAFFIVILFVVSAYALFGGMGPLQQAGFIPLVIAMFYAILGLWKGPRFLVTGLCLTAVTLIGFFYVREFYLYWMALAGGGALIAAGLWLRQV